MARWTEWDLRKFDREFCAWADKTFPHTTRASTVAHMREELDEILDAPKGDKLANECADIIMMALHIAHRESGLNMGMVLDRKFMELQGRTWLPPDENGVVRHRKEE